jgi:membrane peptidoglycan carboxypeptidase
MGSNVAIIARLRDLSGALPERRARASLWTWVVLLLVLTAAAELHASWLQSSLASWVGRQLFYELLPGSSPSIRYPATGPYDRRLGYTELPRKIARLEQEGFSVAAQARLSPALVSLTEWGFPPIYPEKDHAGMRIVDRHAATLRESRHPQRVFPKFTSVPARIVDTLLFIENRELLEPGPSRRNPAIEWDRLAKALSVRAFMRGRVGNAPGGSTLATQIEKYRHSSQGQTLTSLDKLRQIGSATLRAYLDGPNTISARHSIVLAYLNSVPLAAAPGFGEVNGLGDGLHAWYGADLDEVVRLLSGPSLDVEIAARARAYKQVLSLFVAERRPSYYLLADREALHDLTDVYLGLLHRAGIIDSFLLDAALAVQLEFQGRPPTSSRASYVETKATDAVRSELLGLLGESSFYDLDRLDLVVRTTLDGEIQQQVIQALRALGDPAVAAQAGLVHPRMLERGDPSQLVYSLLLFERTPQGNALRVLADTLDRPFNVNEGMKLDLGSTAKLRTLVHYLEIVAALHDQYAGRTPRELRSETAHPEDRIRRFVLERMRVHPDLSLASMLDAALEQRYSADPRESFFTGGGVRRFSNHDPRHDGRSFSLRESLVQSVNLSFIRLMRDIAAHLIFGPTGFAARLESDPEDPWRDEYLRRFADAESRIFVQRFYDKHRERSPEARRQSLVAARPATPRRLAALFRSLQPDADLSALRDFLREHGVGVSEARLERLYAQLGPEKLALRDRAHLARVHPLELWLVEFLGEHPGSTLSQTIEASVEAKDEAYVWLFRTGRRDAQNRRIRAVLEREVFDEIHREWARAGYPFESLVPSLATAIGVSADRPAALAELMGIVQNGGRRLPERRIEAFRFAPGTPYETVLEPSPDAGEAILRPEVADAVKQVLLEVVESGTARRIRGAFSRENETETAIGGKTGTGDSRHKEFAPDGRLLTSRVLSRTASFAFLLGDRHFGVITAYVDGSRAEDYVFTSSLPLQVLRYLDPALASLLGDPRDATSSPRSVRWYDAAPEEKGLADPHDPRDRSAPVPTAGVRPSGRLGPGA